MIGHQRYRLATGGLPLWRPFSGPRGHLDSVGWLGHDLLLVGGWVNCEPAASVLLQWPGAQPTAVGSLSRFRYSRPELRGFSGATGEFLVLETEFTADDVSVLDGVWLELAGQRYRWSLRRGLGIAPDQVDLFEHLLPSMPLEVGLGFQEFILEASARLGVAENDPLLRRSLATLDRLGRFLGWVDEPLGLEPEVEDEVDGGSAVQRQLDVVLPEPDEMVAFERYPNFMGAPTEPFGVCVDKFLVVDEDHVLVVGWLWDFEEAVLDFSLVGPSSRVSLADHWIRVEHPSAGSALTHFGDLTSTKLGFLALVEMPEAIDRPRSCFFEISYRDRVPSRIGPAPIQRNPFEARDVVFASLPSEVWADPGLFGGTLHLALSRLSQRCRDFVVSCDEVEFGTRSSQQVDTSLVIALGHNFHILEAQLASFAEDPSLRTTEIVYVLDHGKHRAAVEHLLFHCSLLYDLPPIRLVTTELAIGVAAAINLGVRSATGEELVLMHSDVIAEERGWLAPLTAAHQSERVGAVVPLLVSHDRSVQNAGVTFSQNLKADRLWAPIDRWKGLPLDVARVGNERILASRDPVLLTFKSLFTRLGGYRDCYAAGDFEDIDFCLRVAEAGFERHYVPDRPLLHLECQTKQWGAGWRRSAWSQLYNRWLLTRRWGESLARLDATAEQDIEVAKERAALL